MTREDISTRALGEALLANLNDLLRPDPEQLLSLDSLTELHAAGIPARRIRALYPLDLTPYADGARELGKRWDYQTVTRGDRAKAGLNAATSAYGYFPAAAFLARDKAIEEAQVGAAGSLLLLVAFATLVARPELYPDDPAATRIDETITTEVDKALRAKVAAVQLLVHDFAVWKAQSERLRVLASAALPHLLR